MNPGDWIPKERAAIRALIDTSENLDDLVRFLGDCADHGVKAMLRPIHEGAAIGAPLENIGDIDDDGFDDLLIGGHPETTWIALGGWR